uniref:Nucleolar protein 58/56 N-terminal domain-containing protein n=1 Tax=Aegilops tauschii subsp. strangulata TaxID=200361 RepID=A0A453ARU7_AEGTS
PPPPQLVLLYTGAEEEMLVLFETPAGFALFKVLDEGKLSSVEDLWKDFASSDKARKVG